MNIKDLEIPSDFFFDIANVPGSSDEVCQKAIDHYQSQLGKTELHPKLIEISNCVIAALTSYRKMASYDSDNLRAALPHLSEMYRFMEAQTSIDMDVESSGRIKSFYSAYVKIFDKIIECIEKDKPLPTKNYLADIWATRDILHPRHDMRYDAGAFYKNTYRLILDFMEKVDELHEDDPRFALMEYNGNKLLDLKRPRKYSFSDETPITVPDKDFLGYAFEIKGLTEGYKYLPELSEQFTTEQIKSLIPTLPDTSNIEDNYINLIKSDSPLVQHIMNRVKFDQLVEYRNTIEQELLDEFDEKATKLLKDYDALPTKDFISEYEHKLSTVQKDRLKYLDFLNQRIKHPESEEVQTIPNIESKSFQETITKHLEELSSNQRQLVAQRINAIKELANDDNFEANYAESLKLKRFSRCCKDYMRYPKRTGYQSFHMVVLTPFGPYEKQIRTEEQDLFAENGPASHTNTYKPDVKSTFHRLKVTTPFSPKRDENGDIIIPTELGLLPFELAVHKYYKQPFSNFTGGKTLAEFKEEHPTKEELDRALLALSPATVSENLLNKIWNKISGLFNIRKIPKPTPTVIPDKPLLTATYYSDVPEDISAMPYLPGTPKRKTTTSFSTDDSDPHGNR